MEIGKNHYREGRKLDNHYLSTGKVSTTFYITNFPGHVDAKDLWKICEPFGRLVDAFIVNKRSKLGKRFGFISGVALNGKSSMSNKGIGITLQEHDLIQIQIQELETWSINIEDDQSYVASDEQSKVEERSMESDDRVPNDIDVDIPTKFDLNQQGTSFDDISNNPNNLENQDAKANKEEENDKHETNANKESDTSCPPGFEHMKQSVPCHSHSSFTTNTNSKNLIDRVSSCTSLFSLPERLKADNMIRVNQLVTILLIKSSIHLLDQNRYPVNTSLIHIRSCKSPTAVLFDDDTRRISIRYCETKEYRSECSIKISRIMRRTLVTTCKLIGVQQMYFDVVS
ncbi:RNA-directed DNA polymerase, eukaryota [Tanacetum coccineum]